MQPASNKPWWYRESPKVVLLTRELLDGFMALKPFPGDRNVRPALLESHEDALSRREFREANFSSVYIKETKEEIRVNGQHTSLMFKSIYDSGKGHLLKSQYIDLRKYECETLADAARLYATFDNAASRRTTSDINKTFAGTDETLRSVGGKILNNAVTGIAINKWGLKHKDGQTPKDRAEEMLRHKDFVLFYAKMCSENLKRSADAKPIKRSPVAAAMMVSFRQAPQKAADFWLAVRDLSHPDRMAPCRKLGEWLREVNVNLGQGNNDLKKSVPTKQMAQYCVQAWNAFKDGKKTVNFKYNKNRDELMKKE